MRLTLAAATAGLLAATTTYAAAVPPTTDVIAASPVVEERATSCTITSFSQVAAAKTSCTTITLGTFQVPAGQTLDLTKLPTGTKVVFTGTITFGFEAWAGPMVSISGTSITVTGQSGHVIDGGGAQWWDGQVCCHLSALDVKWRRL